MKFEQIADGVEVYSVRGEVGFSGDVSRKQGTRKDGKEYDFVTQFIVINNAEGLAKDLGGNSVGIKSESLAINITDCDKIEKGDKLIIGKGKISKYEKDGEEKTSLKTYQDKTKTNVIIKRGGEVNDTVAELPKAEVAPVRHDGLEDVHKKLDEILAILKVEKVFEPEKEAAPPQEAQPITDAQVKLIHTLKTKSKISEDDYRGYMKLEYEVGTSKDLTKEQATEFIDVLQSWTIPAEDKGGA